MFESNAEFGKVLRPLSERAHLPSQVEYGTQSATKLNLNKSLLQQDRCNNDMNGGVANLRWTVMVWESQAARLKLIDRVVSDCGAQAHQIKELSDIQITSCSSCCAAVIALGIYPTKDSFALEIIGRMKQAGTTVIAHERGAHSWSVSVRCRALLAGAVCVLDSEESGFSQELQRILKGVFARKTRELAERNHIHDLMRTFGIVGESDAIDLASQQALRVGCLSDLAVLITGESGTGKELMARAIHQLDPKRCKGPFVAINCGAISSGLAESELFGHGRGAFTGADRDRKGLVRAADGGVLFLDEIGDLGRDMQGKLLRVLQDHRVLSVGTDHDVGVNVRVIAATNRNLELMMERGEFRPDLFHRLNMFSIYLPPLRERTADLKPLIDNFLTKNRSIAQSEISSVDHDFIEALAQLELPGNVRQLENIVRRALLNKIDNTPLNLGDLPPEIWQQLCDQRPVNSGQADVDRLPSQTVIPDSPHSSTECVAPLITRLDSKGWNLSRVVEYCERLLVEAALQRAQGNHSKAARVLGITPRTLYNKLKKPHRESES